MRSLSERLERFPEYIHSRLAKKAREVEVATGRTVLNFGPGSPDFPPSALYKEKLKEFFDDPKAHLYPGFPPIPEFSEGLISWYQRRFGVALAGNELFPLIGGKDGIAHLSLALLDEGDEILLPDPGYPAYEGMALMAGAHPTFYALKKECDFGINLQELEQKISPKTKAIWVNFPANPTGSVITKDQLARIVDIAQKHGVWLLYDNAYSEITFDGFSAPSVLEIPGAKGVALELGSFSKMFSFAGYRIGWVAGNTELIEALAKVKSQVDSGLATPLQKLAGFALSHTDRAWHNAMLLSYRARRDTILSHLPVLGLTAETPKGALYLWARIPEGYADSEAFVFETLEKKQILFTPGTAFGQSGKEYVRISFCINIDTITEYFT
jgi:aspartate/methionine/tyrosine aminotransferase